MALQAGARTYAAENCLTAERRYRTIRLILGEASISAGLFDAETRADWIMQAIERHPEWTVGQAKKLVSLARIAGVMKNNGINADKWCVKHGAHGNGKN